jgi:hypothetical protein
MKPAYFLAPIALLFLSVSCASAAKAPSAQQAAPLTIIQADARMPFADLHRQISDWWQREDGSLLFKGGSKFYHATFMGACPWLSSAERIGFKTDSAGSIDKFSSVIVEGQTCHFNTFDEVANPKPKTAPAT